MDVTQSEGAPRLLISRRAIAHNLRLIRQQLKAGTKVCAMVKADAYSHGAEILLDTFSNFESPGLTSPAVDQLGVACLQEAAELPETSLPILVLRTVEDACLGRQRALIEQAIRKGWILTLGAPAAADDVARIALALQKRAAIHVMIDTGMTRCGCGIDDLPRLLLRIESHPSLHLVSLGTHFATADVAEHHYVAEQFDRFRAATDECCARHLGKIIRTAANSGGIFHFPQTHLDMVRPGISLYGVDPTCRPNMNRTLRPIAKWTAPIISILNAAKGTTVGYGQTWTASADTRIGLIPVGYADGYLRCFGNRAAMIVNGKPAPVVGRVSMDLTTIDLAHAPAARIGDEAIVMDNDPLSPASVYALAAHAGTIPYEIFTRIGRRIRRVPTDPAAIVQNAKP